MTIIDLSKAFDTVNREALWKVLGTCGCPLKFVKVLRCFRDGMQALINFAGDLSEPFPVENGVKQGDLAATVLLLLTLLQCCKLHSPMRQMESKFDIEPTNWKEMSSNSLGY